MSKFAVLIALAILNSQLASAQRFSVNVVQSDASGKAALNDIFGTFQAISSALGREHLQAVGNLENGVRTVELVLLSQQRELANMAANIQEKIDDTLMYDTSGLFKALLAELYKFLDGVMSIADFTGVDRKSAVDTNLASRVASVKGKYATYVLLQTVAAKNGSVVGALMARMNAIFVQNGDAFDEDLLIEYSVLDATLAAFRNELLQYSTALSMAAMKLITLQSDTYMLSKDCTFELPCGTFLPYEPSKDPEAPKRNGLLVGRYWNGQEVFVGAGWTQYGYYTPGRLMIGKPGPGVFMETGSEENDTSTADYLLDHRNLRWVDMTWKQDARFPPNSLYVNNAVFSYGIGRYVASSGAAYIGKVMSEYGFYFSANGTSYSSKKLQILTCIN